MTASTVGTRGSEAEPLTVIFPEDDKAAFHNLSSWVRPRGCFALASVSKVLERKGRDAREQAEFALARSLSRIADSAQRA